MLYFIEIVLHWFKCMNYSLYDIEKYFQKYEWKYHLSRVLGMIIKYPKGTGSGDLGVHGKYYTTKSGVFYHQYICNVQF